MKMCSRLSSRMEVLTDILVSQEIQENDFAPTISSGFIKNYEDVTTVTFHNILEKERDAEVKLLPIHANATPYYPLLDVIAEDVQMEPIKLGKNINLLDKQLLDDDGEMICNFSIADERKLIRTIDGDCEIEFTVRGQNGMIETLCLPIKMFREGKWYRDIFGLNCQEPKLFQKYLESICGELIEHEVVRVRSTGWYQVSGKGWRMITPRGYITSDAEVEVSDKSAEIMPNIRYSECELASLFWDMRRLTRSNVALVLISIVILASLYSLFRIVGFTPRFIVGLIGPRSSRKTSLALVMTNLVNRNLGATPEVTFMTSTSAGIEQKLIQCKDSIMIIDDLMPVTDKRLQKKVEGILEHVVRLFGDAVSTTRNTDFFSEDMAKKVNYKTAGMCLVTGEYFTGCASSRSRCVVLNLEKDTVDNTALSYYQENLDILPGFLWNFLGYVECNQEEILGYVKTRVSARRAQLQGSYTVARFSEYQAQMETALMILFNYLHGVGVLTDSEINTEFESFCEEISQILHDNEHQMSMNDPIGQIRKVISQCYEESPELISNLGIPVIKKADFYENEKCFYVHPQWLYMHIYECMKISGQNSAVIDVPYLKDVLNREGYLVRKKEGSVYRNTVKLPNAAKIGDKRRFLCISKTILGE